MPRGEHTDILDLPTLARQTFGDRALQRDLLTLFDAQCGRLLPIIMDTGSAAEREDAAHALAGSARAVAAGSVAALASELETERDELRARLLAAALQRAVEDVREAIAAHLRSRSADAA